MKAYKILNLQDINTIGNYEIDSTEFLFTLMKKGEKPQIIGQVFKNAKPFTSNYYRIVYLNNFSFERMFKLVPEIKRVIIVLNEMNIKEKKLDLQNITYIDTINDKEIIFLDIKTFFIFFHEYLLKETDIFFENTLFITCPLLIKEEIKAYTLFSGFKWGGGANNKRENLDDLKFKLSLCLKYCGFNSKDINNSYKNLSHSKKVNFSATSKIIVGNFLVKNGISLYTQEGLIYKILEELIIHPWRWAIVSENLFFILKQEIIINNPNPKLLEGLGHGELCLIYKQNLK